MCKVLLNNELNGIELYFEGKPAKSVIDSLKAAGYRWHGKKVCWYAKQTEKTINLGNELSGSSVEVATVKKVDKLDLYSLVQFELVERELIYDTKVIAKEVRNYLKKRFSFVKFSITTKRYNSINCTIKAAPFKKDSKYLAAIKDYCVKYVDTYNYNNSDSMTDYFDVNFYGGYFDICYDYEQTEPTAELIEAMAQYDIKEAEAIAAQKAEEERQYKIYLAEREEARKAAEQRRLEKEAQKEDIYNNIEVVDLEESKQYYVKDAYFANLNKNSTLEKYNKEVEKGDYYLNSLKVTREIKFTSLESLNNFKNMLLVDFDFIQGTGGSYTEDVRINDMSDYYNMSREEQKTVEWLLKGIAVYYNNELVFVIDAQGYSYARYVGIIGTATSTTKEYNYNQVLSAEEIEEYTEQAENIINIVDTIPESENNYITRKNLADRFKNNNIKLNNNIVQQVKDINIKTKLYNVLKENDTIKDQFSENNFTIGDKLTIIRESMLAGASITHVTYLGHEVIENSIKLNIKINGKRGEFTTKINNKDNILIYSGWNNLPESVLYEQTNGGIITKYGSYDKAALDAILKYYNDSNIKPIINTFKPAF